MTFEERLDGVNQTLELLAHMFVESERRFEERQTKFEEDLARTQAVLRRAIRDGIQAVRHERKMRHEMDARFDEKMTQLAAAQLITEEKHREIQKSLETLIRTITARNGDGQKN